MTEHDKNTTPSTERDIRVVYFSSVTEYTKRFVEKLGYPAERIPLRRKDPFLYVDYDYVLIIPTYGGGTLKGAVLPQIKKFLAVEQNRRHCKGVAVGGNRNFAEGYCIAGDAVSRKLKVPVLHRFEFMGLDSDVEIMRQGLEQHWDNLPPSTV